MRNCNICRFKDIDILTDIFKANSDELAVATDDDREYLSKNNIDIDKAHKRILNAIDNIPNAFAETITELKGSVEDLIDQSSFEQGYLCEKYFCNGIKKGIDIVIDGVSEYLEN